MRWLSQAGALLSFRDQNLGKLRRIVFPFHYALWIALSKSPPLQLPVSPETSTTLTAARFEILLSPQSDYALLDLCKEFYCLTYCTLVPLSSPSVITRKNVYFSTYLPSLILLSLLPNI